MPELQQAIDLLLNKVPLQNKTKICPLLDATNQVVARDYFAQYNIPQFPKSAMDGYAIKASDSATASKDSPVRLKVVGEIFAGDNYTDTPGDHSAVRVMTGSFVPPPYDAVIKQEDTDYGEDVVQIYKELKPFDNYCPIGEDIKDGERVIGQFTRLTSEHIGVLASLGCSTVEIIEPLRIGIISTGSELTTPVNSLGPVQTYNSSAYVIASYLKSIGATISLMEICPDDVGQFTELFQKNQHSFDILITTGGVSVGKKDIMPEALGAIGAEVLFRGARIKPGTPVIGSFYDQIPILSLSGNPFAALVNFHLFFWPLYAKMMRNDSFLLQRRMMTLLDGHMKPSKITRYIRAHASCDGVSIYTKRHFSSVLSNTLIANCLIEQLPLHALEPGDHVPVLLWPNHMAN